MGGLNVAIWDALGKTLDVPLCKLLGGKARDRIPVYASGGYLTHDPDNQLAAQLERVAGGNYPGFKIKIGLGPRSDVERIGLAREIIGPEPLLLVDVNGNYTVDMTLESMRRTERYDVHYYEEPLAPQDYEGYRRLGQRASVAVAAGEAHYTVFDFKRLIETGGVDVLQPDITLCGGLDQARQIWQLGVQAGLRLSPHVWGSAVGLAAAVHFMAALPAYPHTDNLPFPALMEYDVGWNALRDELLTTPLQAVDGHVRVPEGPGLGIELDAGALARFRLA
jgi:D-galactarolactone cycloisomerase